MVSSSGIEYKPTARMVSQTPLPIEAALTSNTTTSTHHLLAHQTPNPAAASAPSTGPHLLTTLLTASRFTRPILTAKLPESFTIGNALPTGTSTPRKSHSGAHPCSTLYSKRRHEGSGLLVPAAVVLGPDAFALGRRPEGRRAGEEGSEH